MKISIKYILLSTMLLSLTACQSTAPKAAPRKPEPVKDYIDNSGSFGTGDTYLFSEDAFLPDPSYNKDIRNRNNFVKLNVKLNNERQLRQSLPIDLDLRMMTDILQNAFEKTKRFSLLSQNASDAGIVLDINLDLNYDERPDVYSKNISCDVTMTIIGYNPDRKVQEFGLNLNFSDLKEFKKMPNRDVSNDDRRQFLYSCIENCFKKVLPELYKNYPIVGNVTSARDSGDRILLGIDRGSEDGIQQGIPFVIAYNDSYGNEIFVANGKAASVSTNSSQIVIDNWNPTEKREVENAKDNIRNSNMNYIENMFCVSKYRQRLSR